MKGKEIWLALFMGIVLPGIVFFVADKFLPDRPLPSKQETISAEQAETTAPSAVANNKIFLQQKDGLVESIDLETYLVGVLLGEMPMDFDIEALKAQAVVARTYTLRRCVTAPKHTFGGICTDAVCCQAYCSAEEYIAGGGAREAVDKAASAVRATEGQVLTYNSELIEATYFSCSGGRTEDAVAVWGTQIPYLQAVDSPGEENASHYMDSVSFTAAEFAARLGLNLSGAPADWFGTVTYTSGRGVDTMLIGGVSFKGTQLRELLDIRSTAFTVTPLGDTIHITTRGFGHRVGMSQYGAEAMAVSGSAYSAILAHYYPGTQLVAYNPD